MAKLRDLLRTPVWWSYKIPGLLTPVYFIALASGVSAVDILGPLAGLLVYLLATAALGHVLNDLGDIRTDARAGRINQMARLTWRMRTILVCVLLIASVLPFAWLHAPPLLWILMAAEIGFFLAYGFRPLRLKERMVGVLADAAYAHILPLLIVVVGLTAQLSAEPFSGATALLGMVLAWQGVCGVRCIMLHQTVDRLADEKAGVRTAVVRMGPKVSLWLQGALLPGVEVILFLAVLAAASHSCSWLILLYAAFVTTLAVRNHKHLGQPFSSWRYDPLFTTHYLDQFYCKWLPAIVLLYGAFQDPAFLLLLAAHVLLFGPPRVTSPATGPDGRYVGPPPPKAKGDLDVPAAGADLHDVRPLARGWSLSPSEEVQRIAVFIDDVLVGEVQPTLSRPDVAAVYPNIPGADACGFELLLPLRRPSPHRTGPSPLHVIVTTRTGRRWIHTRRNVNYSPLLFYIDSPFDEAVVCGGKVSCDGWAVHLEQTVDAVCVRAGGRELARVRVQEPRPDVYAALSEFPGAARCGFRVWVDLSDSTDPTSCLGIFAELSDGTTELLEEHVVHQAHLAEVSLQSPAEKAQASADGLWVSGTCRVPGAEIRVRLDGKDRWLRHMPEREGMQTWSVLLDIDDGAERVDLEAQMRAGDAPWTTFAHRRMAVAEPSLVCEVELPAQVPRSGYSLYGTCLPLQRRQRIARIDVELEDIGRFRARLGLASPQLAARFAAPGTAVAGFEAQVPFHRVPSSQDAVKVRVLATDLTGDTSELTAGQVSVSGVATGEVTTVHQPLALHQRDPLPPDSPLQVLVFCHDLSYGGGAQLYLVEHLRHLLGDGRWHAAVVAPHDGPLATELHQLGADVRISPVAGQTPEDYETWVQKQLAWAREQPFDTAFANTLDSFAGVEVAARAGLPCAWSIHESWPLEDWVAMNFSASPARNWIFECAQRGLARVQAAVFAADGTRRLFTDHIDEGRSLVLPYGIDVAVFQRLGPAHRVAVRQRLGLPADALVVLCLGIFQPRKTQTMLVEAFRQAAGRHPGAHLVLVGGNSDHYSEALLTSLVADGDCNGRIHAYPISPSPLLWLAAADALVSPSDVESLPFVILEAMAGGLVVAATRIFGVPELIRDGDNGLLFEPNDLRELVTVVGRILTMEPRQRRRMARAGQATVEAYHHAADAATAHDALMRQLVADPDAPPVDAIQATGAPGLYAGWQGRSASGAGIHLEAAEHHDTAPASVAEARPFALDAFGRAARVAFVHVPKTAGTFVDAYISQRIFHESAQLQTSGNSDWTEEELLAFLDRDEPSCYVHNHAESWTYEAFCRYRDAGFFTFAFVRDPAEQLCSAFFMGIRDKLPGADRWSLDKCFQAYFADFSTAAAPTLFSLEALHRHAEEIEAPRHSHAPPDFWRELDFVAPFSTESFAMLLAYAFGHKYWPMERRNVSANPGYEQLRRDGQVSDASHELYMASPQRRQFEEICEAARKAERIGP